MRLLTIVIFFLVLLDNNVVGEELFDFDFAIAVFLLKSLLNKFGDDDGDCNGDAESELDTESI